jgi:hypothetical protein
MSSTKEAVQRGKLSGSRKNVWIYFFGTIGVLFLITVILITITQIRTPSEELIKAAKYRTYMLIEKYTDETLGISFPDTEALIDKQIDNAFAPVYENIGAFADAHYTVTGEYTELFYAAAGQLENRIEEILFEGLQERLDVAVGHITAGFLDELEKNFGAEHECSQDGVAKEKESECHAAMDIAIDDMLRRFEASDLALKGSMAIGGLAAGVLITKTISAAIAKKLVAVTAAKATVKLSGTATGAATGAAIGTILPGAGTAAGGIIGGIVGWFLVDKVVIEVDEYMHRDDFEKKVTAQIDEQKAQVKAEIRQFIEATIIDVKNKTPAELIRSSP